MSSSIYNSLMKDLDPDFLSTEDGRFLQMAHSMYERELDLQNDSLREKAIDCDFYDNDQISEQDRLIYELRNQEPKVYNHIKPTVDWLLGSERRTRSDWNILPRSENDVQTALVKTKLVKYVEDINNARFARSAAFEDMVKSGEGWLRVGLERDSEGDLRVTIKHEPWNTMLRDSTSRRQDLEDCKVVWKTKAVDYDDLAAAFPDQAEVLKREIQDYDDIETEIKDQVSTDHYSDGHSDWVVQRKGSMGLSHYAGQYISQRKAVRVWEMWYRKTERVDVLNRAGRLNGQVFDKNNPEHVAALSQGARVVNTLRKSMYCALYTRSVVMYNKRSPYEHNRFPFVARFAYIKNRNGWTYGIIRQIRDPQKDLNSRKNKALWLMSVCQVIMEKGAIKDKNDLANQIAKADGIIEYEMGKEIKIIRGAEFANQHLNVANQDAQSIQEVSGVTGQNRGTDGVAKSGIAIKSLQEQGSVITTPLIDNHIGAHQHEGELVLSMCEQYIDYQMQFRITGDNPSKPEFVSLNDPDDPTTNINDTKADFIVARKDYRDTFRQSMSEILFNIAGAISNATGDPRLALGIIEMAVDLQDIPEKQSITERLRQLLDLPKRNESDEERAQREQQEKAQRDEQMALQKKMQNLEIAKQEIEIASKQAQAKQQLAEAAREESNALSHKADAIAKIYNAAAIVVQNPQLAKYADDLMQNIDNILRTGQMDEKAIEMLKGISATTGAEQQQQPPVDPAQGQPPQDQQVMPPQQ